MPKFFCYPLTCEFSEQARHVDSGPSATMCDEYTPPAPKTNVASSRHSVATSSGADGNGRVVRKLFPS
jgi:hypothetical protein